MSSASVRPFTSIGPSTPALTIRASWITIIPTAVSVPTATFTVTATTFLSYPLSVLPLILLLITPFITPWPSPVQFSWGIMISFFFFWTKFLSLKELEFLKYCCKLVTQGAWISFIAQRRSILKMLKININKQNSMKEYCRLKHLLRSYPLLDNSTVLLLADLRWRNDFLTLAVAEITIWCSRMRHLMQIQTFWLIIGICDGPDLLHTT